MLLCLALQAHSALHRQHIAISNASPLYSLSVDIDAANGDPDDPVAGPAVVKIVSRATGKPIQTIRMPSVTLFKGSYSTSVGAHGKPPSLYDDEFSFVFEDFNFDGHQDLAICKDTTGGYGGPTYDVFLWNPVKKQFVRNLLLTQLCTEHLGLIDVDSQRHELTVFDKDGAAWHHSSTYKWIKKQLTLIEEEEDDARGDQEVVTTRTKVGRNWRKKIRRIPKTQ